MNRRRDVVIQDLEASARGFLDAIDGLSSSQWAFKPAPDRWSILETAEHVAVVNRGIHRLLTTKLLAAPLTAEQKVAMKDKDDLVIRMMFDRSVRQDAPELVRPTSRWTETALLIRAFEESRDGTIAWTRAATVELREYALPHPALGLLDGTQWLLFMAAHTERHTRQVLETKAVQGFPA